MTTKLFGRAIELSALLIAGGLLAGTAAFAQDGSKAKKPFYCFAFMNPMDGRGVETAHSPVMLGSPDDKAALQRSFFDAAQAAGTLKAYPYRSWSGCYFFDEADQAVAHRNAKHKSSRESVVARVYEAGELRWDGGGLASPLTLAAKGAVKRPNLNKKAESPSSPQQVQPKQSIAEAVREAELARNAAREAREAEFQAKLAAHKARVEEYERQVAQRNEEIARQQAKHALAQDAAAREKAAYEEKLAAHRRELDEANRRQQAYFEAQRRHALCVNGERKWCEGPAVTDAKLADAGRASTDTDATRCVTSPDVFPSKVWKNTMEARVVNNCETSVDIVICLNRPEGWACGVQMGVSPRAGMSFDAKNSNGQVFWDARVMGSTKPLGRPS